MNKEVKILPIVHVTIWRRILSKLPFHCSYCGKKYVKCHSNKINILMPLPQNGRCCPDGHEGYTDEFIGFDIIRHWFDNTKTAQLSDK